jgi:hypothetical protein
MKKLLLACSLFIFTAAATQAQDKEVAKAELSKEKKAELKKLKEENLNASFTEIGLKEEQVKLAKTAIEEANKKGKELREDNALTEEQRKAKKEVINDEKNAKLKEIIGDRFKEWQAIRKKQKAAEEEFVSANSKG